jgi:hypothetical protein
MNAPVKHVKVTTVANSPGFPMRLCAGDLRSCRGVARRCIVIVERDHRAGGGQALVRLGGAPRAHALPLVAYAAYKPGATAPRNCARRAAKAASLGPDVGVACWLCRSDQVGYRLDASGGSRSGCHEQADGTCGTSQAICMTFRYSRPAPGQPVNKLGHEFVSVSSCSITRASQSIQVGCWGAGCSCRGQLRGPAGLLD